METEQEITTECRDTACRVRENEAAPTPDTEITAKLIAREAEVAKLSQQLAEKDDVIGRLNASLNAAVAAYRGTTVTLHRDLPEELIEGDSIAAVDESIKKAMSLVARVKSTMATTAPPLVAAGRSRSSEGLSTVDKIMLGLSH
ncbi:hypothetical protein [Dehalogenimonas etheniformans]|uniref:Uncharacterized protein n=1 Tax=Dehalogenimonas etheniformans TaxID=1536648 RepID=A0A2P5P6U7_9CHLR|nr:hypothetical protein [Dehalogenimonas etheniformans]PPD58017.1 hypothetical protein JP09_006925 [Dehalogenimonas etheniformans]QNT75367.1 hypothetical protein HX448_01010 [Dehalogenimonas etheniformans]